mmetsp:Transcript_291/g.720  ORF Transcript_291/g.720 Transcript_291/m.720 type:complete len:396 (+) Transcript_291:2628-3815(+)
MEGAGDAAVDPVGPQAHVDAQGLEHRQPPDARGHVGDVVAREVAQLNPVGLDGVGLGRLELVAKARPLPAGREGKDAGDDVIVGQHQAHLSRAPLAVIVPIAAIGKLDLAPEGGQVGVLVLARPAHGHVRAQAAGLGRRRQLGLGLAGVQVERDCGRQVVIAHWDVVGERHVGEAAGGQGHVGPHPVAGRHRTALVIVKIELALRCNLGGASDVDPDAGGGLDGGVVDHVAGHAGNVPTLQLLHAGHKVARRKLVGQALVAPAERVGHLPRPPVKVGGVDALAVADAVGAHRLQSDGHSDVFASAVRAGRGPAGAGGGGHPGLRRRGHGQRDQCGGVLVVARVAHAGSKGDGGHASGGQHQHAVRVGRGDHARHVGDEGGGGRHVGAVRGHESDQ